MQKKRLLSQLFLTLVMALVLVVTGSQLALAAAEDTDWDAMYAEQIALGQEPITMSAPQSALDAGFPFDYALLTPDTKDVPDSEAFVIVLMGDGFTEADMAKWHYYCQYYANNVIKYNPFNEFLDILKIYRVDVLSKDSGTTRGDSPDGRNLEGTVKDTYFDGYLWSRNMARLGGANTKLGIELANAYIPENTESAKTMLLNTTVYGGSGGSLAYATLHWAFLDVAVHEMTHNSGMIPDEYLYSGVGQLNTAKSDFKSELTNVHRDWIDDPDWLEWSPWSRFLGKDGVTFDPWLEGLSTDPGYADMFRPTCDCKMRYVGANLVWDETGEEEFEFCALCKEQWRDRLCIMSASPVLHFQPYNDQFYDSVPVQLNNKHFILRLPEEVDPNSSNMDGVLCKKVYGEEMDATTPVNGITGSVTMTVYAEDGTAVYEDVPVDTEMRLEAGTYSVEATFTGTYNGEPIELELRSLPEYNVFTVQPQTIVTAVGKYAEPWNSEDKMDTLSRGWIADTPVTLPELGLDVTRVGGTDLDEFEITYSWHVRNFDGSVGMQVGEVGTYPTKPADGPSAVGQYILCIHSEAVSGPAKEAGYAITNEYPFDITSTFYDASHYEIEGGIYSHELVSNDFRGITILGEGFTEDELDEFEEKANDFITAFLETDPVSRMTERFCFFIETSMSAQSGITKENGEHKDTYYGFQLNEDGTIGTYRTDTTMDVILLQEVWRRDTNMKTWAQWGATVVLLNEEEEQANLNWRHPESNRSVHLATVADGDYTRLIESLVTQFAHVRSNRDADLLDTYRWMEGPEQNATFEDVYQRLIESCYSHEMYGAAEYNNLPRPVIVSDASTKVYVTDGTQVLNWDVPETFEAYAYGHALQVNTCAEDTFTYRYYTDDNHRVGELLDGPPVEPGYYWAEADLPGGPKFFRDTYTDKYGFTYEAGQALPGVNGDESVANSSTRVRGFVRFQIVEQEEGEPTPVEIQIKLYDNDGKDDYETITAVVGETYGDKLNYKPVYQGYTFTGWNTKADGTGERITADSIVQEDVLELYAMWKEDPDGNLTDWDAMYAEQIALGQEPITMSAPQSAVDAGFPFDYALLTPDTKDVPDSEAFLVVLMGDGFTEADMAKWHYYCQYYANNMVKFNPFDEFLDILKIYRIDVISNSSGVLRSDSPDGRLMANDEGKDTYFGSSLWSRNTARGTTASNANAAREMTSAYFPTNLDPGRTILMNTEVYGGIGGNPSLATLHWAWLDVAVHEMTHGNAKIPDEYLYSGIAQVVDAKANFKSEFNNVHRDWIDDPDWLEWSPWSRFLGKDGITFDPYLEGLSTDPDYANLFRPSVDCKMRYVGANLIWEETGEEEFEYCALCKEQWRDRMCIMSASPVLHFQPYNDQFYDSVPVQLNNKHFILRLPEAIDPTSTDLDSVLCKKVYGEEMDATTPVNGVTGSVTMTVYDGEGTPVYEDVPVDTAMRLEVGTYRVEATFTGTYNGEAIELELRSLPEYNVFTVQPQTIVTAVGKHAEPWNSEDKMDTLSRGWIADTPVTLPELELDVTRVGGTDLDEFEITYSWHVRNFDGSVGMQVGEVGTYPTKPADGPSAVGQYILCIHSEAVSGPAKEAGYAVTNEYPFDITSTFYDASHYEIEGGIYSHELVSNDFRGITILGEGFTEDELDEFEEKANDFITAFLETDPVSRMTERFCFFIETSMSAQSGITKENGEHKDTYYGFQLNEDGTIGTYRTDTTMDVILLQEVWRRDTNMKTWAQWGATVVLLNEEEEQANLNWRHPESNRSVHLATVADGDYTRLIESLVTQFAHVRSNRDADLLDTYRWMEGPEQNATFEDVYLRLIESCYSHEMYGNPEYNNLPRPVIVSDASTKLYVTDGTQVLNWDVPETFEAYAYGHALQVNTCAEDTFTYRYYTDDNHRVGELLDGPPVEPGYYWAEADLPGGPKFFRDTYTDRYGYTYEAGQALPGVNGDESVANSSTRVRGFVRFQIVEQEEGEPTPVEIQIKLYHNDGKDGYQTIKAVVGQTYEEALNYTPYRRGYRFVGWNTEADGTGERITADSIVQEDVLELYAMWRELPQDDEDDDTPDTDPVIKPGQDDEDPDSKPGGIIVLPEKKLPFVDVLTSDWFYADVEAAWKDGLINGMTATTFEPEGQITLAQAIKLAACMNQKANTGKVTLSNGSPIWYSSYVQYAIEKGIIREGQFTDYDRAATRAEFAQIFAAALPESSYTAMNTVGENKIPDVKISDSYGAAVYKLYRAGILTGNDAQGTFAPNTNIKRSEVAAIVNRMMHTDARISISL